MALLGEGEAWGLPGTFHTLTVIVLGSWCVFSRKTRFVFWLKYLTVSTFVGFFGSVGFLMLCQSWEPHKTCPTYATWQGSPLRGHSRAETGGRAGRGCCCCTCALSRLLARTDSPVCPQVGAVIKNLRSHYIYTYCHLNAFSGAKQGVNYHWSFGHSQDTCMNLWLLPQETQEFHKVLWLLNCVTVVWMGPHFLW